MNAAFLSHLNLGTISKVTPVGGGDINQAFRLESSTGPVFLLLQPNHKKDFFIHEVNGLACLATFVKTPQVLRIGEWGDNAYLVLSYVAHQSQGDAFALGTALARIHQQASPQGQFGFDESFTMGTYTADNSWQKSWSTFFVQQRLMPLRKMIRNQGLWSEELDLSFQAAIKQFERLMVDYQAQPSLLHGDLWSGNYIFGLNGEPILIDPAVFYGDREFDIGIKTVFGGFSDAFYRGYQATYPLTSGYERRILFYQLYYLMFHLSQFGTGYLAQVQQKLVSINQQPNGK